MSDAACIVPDDRLAQDARRSIAKSVASDRVIIDTIVNKYCDHLPLFRQSAMLERKTG